MKLREWNARLHGLVVFRSLLDDPVVAKLLDLTDRMEAGAPGYGPVCDAVAQFEAALFEHTTNWGSYLSAAVLEAETVCVRQAASGTLAPALQTALDSELAFLRRARRAKSFRVRWTSCWPLPALPQGRRRSWPSCPGGRPPASTCLPPTPSA